jgi:hypothetical protein
MRDTGKLTEVSFGTSRGTIASLHSPKDICEPNHRAELPN